MKKHLWQCATEDEQVDWIVSRLREGRQLRDPLLFLGGVDRPVRTVGRAKAILRAEGLSVASSIAVVKDAQGEDHPALAWRLAGL
ncbi:hypothetical protein KXS07_31515 [Inquilinus limosus]|uniref:hypothetical protein n=1 Tax=Inquilinus limosus TaxID=171674 RepID=UPI003F180468